MLRWLLGILVLLVVAGGAFLFVEMRELNVTKITDDLHMLDGKGGNVAVLRTGEGTVIVDTMTFQMQGDLIKKKAEELTGEPVSLIINTHWHLDHTHGNPAFDAGTRVVATENTLKHLKALDADYWEGDKAALLPQETFTTEKEISIGGKTIKLFHPGRGHTDGDLIAHFVEDDAVHFGDLYFNHHYPNIDLEAGGTVQGWSETLDRAMEFDFTHAIPGHGELTGREGVEQFRSFIDQLAQVGRDAAEAGWTLEETIEKADLTADANYTEITMIVPIGLDRDFVIQRAWEEATGAVASDSE